MIMINMIKWNEWKRNGNEIDGLNGMIGLTVDNLITERLKGLKE